MAVVRVIAAGGAIAVLYYAWHTMEQQKADAINEQNAAIYNANLQAEQAKAARKRAILNPTQKQQNPWAPVLEWGLGEVMNRSRSAPRGGGLGGFLDRIFGGKGQGGTPPIRPTRRTPRQSAPVTRPSGGQANYSGTGPGGVDFGAYEQKYRLPGGYLERTAQIESAMNPKAKNPRSSAGGLFQFINSTAKDYGLKDRYDPAQATDAASRLARDNQRQLRRTLGREPTAAELYLAHQQGGGGASKLLVNPNRRASEVVGSAAVRLNGGSPDMTAGQFANLWIDKFNRGRS